MKVEGNTIILSAGEQITIKSQETAQVAQPVAEPVQTVETAPANGMKFNLINKTNETVYFSGKLKLYIKQGNTNVWDNDGFEINLCGPDDISDGWPHWRKNSYSLAPGQSKELTITEIKKYVGTGTPNIVNTVTESLSKYVGWSFVSTDKDGTFPNISIPAVKLGVSVTENGKVSNSAFILHIKPINSQVQLDKTYDLIIDAIKPGYKPNADKLYSK